MDTEEGSEFAVVAEKGKAVDQVAASDSTAVATAVVAGAAVAEATTEITSGVEATDLMAKKEAEATGWALTGVTEMAAGAKEVVASALAEADWAAVAADVA